MGRGIRKTQARTISVVLERREDASWLARLGERPSLTATGGSIAQARKRLSERIARDAPDLARLAVREQILLPRAGHDAVMALDQARAALADAERASVVMLVRGLGFTVRDASEALGVSMRRVVHLAGEAADLEAEEKFARRVLTGDVAARRSIPR